MMAKPIRLAIIGAGSAQFSLQLVMDMCLTPNMSGSQVCLMDINEERLLKVHNIATRYARELGFDLRFERTTSREAALRDADFILNTASAGAHGDGGIAEVHNIRLMVAVARDADHICPNAWLIQSGNPVFEGCTAMTRATSLKVVGLCHGHYGVYQIIQTLGLDESQVSWQAVGFNHVIYLTHFYYHGEDAYPLLDRWIADKSQEFWRDYHPRYYDNQLSRAAIEQYKMVGYMPIGDAPRTGGWWYHKDLATKQRWYGPLGGFDSEAGWALYINELEERRARLFAVADDPSASVTAVFPPHKSREQIMPIMDALTNDVSGYFQVNIPNNGLIGRILADVVVEVPAFVSKRGIQGLQVGDIPASVMCQVLWPRLAQAERAVNLALNPTRAQLLDIILNRHIAWSSHYAPPVESYEQAQQVLAETLREDPELAALVGA
ncbi:MAG: family 4 glycosyl hydrolase [Anaerolineae bacterium]